MKYLILFALMIVANLATPAIDIVDNTFWAGFKSAHNKRYGSLNEEVHRYNIFMENLAEIEEHNRQYEHGLVTFTKAINQFGDMTKEEFLAYVSKYQMRKSPSARRATFQSSAGDDLPNEVDWRSSNVVTGVKDQGQCGSCWAFSATGSLEGQNALVNKNLVALSEQQLVDCSGEYGNFGCGGGLMDYAFQYVIDNGIECEKDYSYEEVDDECKYNASKVVVRAKSFVDVTPGSEDDLKEAVAKIGPVSVAIDATFELQFYSSGYFYDASCSTNYLNHGVLAIGYGVEDGKDVWYVKNSWGPLWGDRGYVKMARNRKNNCGIATDASYPVL